MPTVTVEMAQRQRHLALLEKVRNRQTLTKSELSELEEYEKKMAKEKVKIETKKTKTKPKGKTPRKPPKKTSKPKKTKVKRLPISIAKIRELAIVSAHIAAAEAETKLKRPLANILTEFPKLQQAWERGRMLRDLKQLAATAVTITEAEEALGMEPGQLKTLLETDLEIADIWNEARLETIIDVKRALVDSAKDGKMAAAKQIEELLRREIAHPKIDYHKLTIQQMMDLTSKSRQTIYDWTVKHGLPQNADKTYNLTDFLVWFEEFLIKKAGTGGKPALAYLNPLQEAKAEQLKIQMEKARGQLLDRMQVITGQVARHQILVNSLSRHNADKLAMECHGSSQDKTAGILAGFFDEVRRQQCQVPDELRLAAEPAKIMTELLEAIKPKGD